MEFKNFIKKWNALQKDNLISICPRCGKELDTKPATSRRANINICTACCIAEATADIHNPPLKDTLETWFASKVLRCESLFDSIQNTSAGQLNARAYDDTIAKGLEITLNDDIVCIVDVYEPVIGEEVGEVRILPFKEGQDEPRDVISYNR